MRLEAAAEAWRSLQSAAESADETVSAAGRRVLGGGGWSGETADSYNQHRRRVAAELGFLGEQAGRVPGTLEELSAMLRINQEILTQAWETLADVPATRGPALTFRPADARQTELVSSAIETAKDVRSRVDAQLGDKLAVIGAVQLHFARITDDWKPRTIGMMNINIGQGYKNEPWPVGSAGTDKGDIGDIAQTIAGADVEIVTIQEMFGREAENLERELEARTGDEWTVYFGEASSKPYWNEAPWDTRFGEPFGNVVAVRHGGAIESSEYIATHDLNESGDLIHTPEGVIIDGEERSALEIEVTFSGR